MPQRALPTPSATSPTRLSLDHSEQRWRRWIAGLETTALGPILAPHSRSDSLARAWTGAVRQTSARVLLAGIRERLLDGEFGRDHLRAALPDGAIELRLASCGPFELHRLALDDPDLDRRIDDPLALIAAVARAAGLDAPEIRRVQAEIHDSLINLAQARLAAVIRDALARDPARDRDDPRLCDPEHFVPDGHPWHPMTRVRLGLRRAEVVRYAAEQLASTPVACVEIAQDHARVAGSWTELCARWWGRATPGFVRVPVHPATLARLPATFPELLERGALRPVAGPVIASRSLLSLRTVAIDPRWHLKLACPVHTTSTTRVVSPMSVHNGPVVSALIAAIQARDDETASVRLMPEPAAAGLEPTRVGPEAARLGAILREVPAAAGDAQIWVCAALADRWPGTDARVIERACAGYPGGLIERLDALIDDWLAALAPAALRLFSRYGVALELHPQNTLAAIRHGRLDHIRVRDLGGIRLHRPRLARVAWLELPRLAADSFIMTDDLAEVRGKLEHTLFHAHLGTLFEAAASCAYPQARAWAKVRALLDRCYARWKSAPGPGAAPDREDLRAELGGDLTALTQPEVRAKALLQMRLTQRSSDYDYTRVANALADPSSPS